MVLFVFFHNFIYSDSISFLHRFIDDILAVPIIGTIILYFHRRFRDESYTLPLSHIVTIVVALTLVFEIVLPFFSNQYTRDLIDVAAYTIGAAFFHLEINNLKC